MEYKQTSTPASQGQWLKLSEAARQAGVAEITLRRKIKTNKVKYQMREGKYFILTNSDGFPVSTEGTEVHSQTQSTDSTKKIEELKLENQKIKRKLLDLETLISFLEEDLNSLKKSLKPQKAPCKPPQNNLPQGKKSFEM